MSAISSSSVAGASHPRLARLFLPTSWLLISVISVFLLGRQNVHVFAVLPGANRSQPCRCFQMLPLPILSWRWADGGCIHCTGGRSVGHRQVVGTLAREPRVGSSLVRAGGSFIPYLSLALGRLAPGGRKALPRPAKGSVAYDRRLSKESHRLGAVSTEFEHRS